MSMFCCANCFNDVEIKSIILTNSTNRGYCNFCSTSDTEIIDTSEISEYFQPILNAYQPILDAQRLLEGISLPERVINDWPSLFRFKDIHFARNLIASIIKEDPECDILTQPVELKNTPYESQETYWDRFVSEIKYGNRFFISNTIDLKLLQDLLIGLSKQYVKGKVFYRARISDKEGFNVSDMGKPPHDKSVAGRANPKGISYLYLSSDTRTTLYETRSTLYDYVSIAEFKLLDNMKVVNLQEINKASPFRVGDALIEHLIHRKYLLRLERELSKPIRKYDSELDYLPTQYLSEFIKSLGFDGVEYRSSLNPAGFNLAIFNDSLFRCNKVNIHEIKSIEYDTEIIM